ncbi:MAG: hypothetical protein R3C12_21785 [Planctomycetaceae bacterium]
MIVMQGQPQLLKVVLARTPPGRFTGLLDSRQQQGDQDGNDRDDDEKLDQGET